MKPSKMSDVTKVLNANEYSSFVLKLRGHASSDWEDLISTHKEDWMAQFDHSVCELRKIATNRGGNLLVLGYSLGGVIASLGLKKSSSSIADKVILMAPALSLKWFSRLIPILPNFSLPSRSDKTHRVHSWLPVKIYQELIDLVTLYHKQRAQITIPTLVVLSKSDELLNSEDIYEMFSNIETSKVFWMRARKGKRSHLLPDPNSQTPESWKLFEREVSQFLAY